MVKCENCKHILGIEGDIWCDKTGEDIDPEAERDCSHYEWEDWEGIRAEAEEILLDDKIADESMERFIAQEHDILVRTLHPETQKILIEAETDDCGYMVWLEDLNIAVCIHPGAMGFSDEEDYIEDVGIRCTQYLEKGCFISSVKEVT